MIMIHPIVLSWGDDSRNPQIIHTKVITARLVPAPSSFWRKVSTLPSCIQTNAIDCLEELTANAQGCLTVSEMVDLRPDIR